MAKKSKQMTEFENICINAIFGSLGNVDWFGTERRAQEALRDALNKGLTESEEEIYRNVSMRYKAMTRSLSTLTSDLPTEFHWWNEKAQNFDIQRIHNAKGR